VPEIPRVGVVELLAVKTLTSSLAGHEGSKNQSPHGAPPPTIPEETATPRRNRPHRRSRRKKTISKHSEEDPAEEDPIFKPAGLPHFQIGDNMSRVIE
jgi:hypothetical protein